MSYLKPYYGIKLPARKKVQEALAKPNQGLAENNTYRQSTGHCTKVQPEFNWSYIVENEITLQKFYVHLF